MTDINRIRQKESERQLMIRGYGKEFGIDDIFVETLINNGASIDQANKFFMDELAKRNQSTFVPSDPLLYAIKGRSPSLGFGSGENKEYSLMKALRTSHGELDGIELEAHRALFDKMSAWEKQQYKGGTLVPWQDLKIRSNKPHQRSLMNTQEFSAGGALVETNLIGFIDVIRANSLVMEMGPTELKGLIGNISLPRQISESQTFWIGENNVIPSSKPDFDAQELKPKTLAVITEMSRNILLQSSVDLENIVRRDLAIAMSRGVDTGFLWGSGQDNSPLGLFQRGIGNVVLGENGGPFDYDLLVELERIVANSNVPLDGNFGYLSNANVRAAAKRTTENSSNVSKWIWEQSLESPHFGTMNGYRTGISNNIKNDLTKGSATDLSAIIFGNFSDLLIGHWGNLELMVNPYTHFETASISIRALQTVDATVRHDESFACCTEVATA